MKDTPEHYQMLSKLHPKCTALYTKLVSCRSLGAKLEPFCMYNQGLSGYVLLFEQQKSLNVFFPDKYVC